MNSPVLLVVDPGYATNPFGNYLGEILKTEGFVAHETAAPAQVDLPYLRRFPIVILAEMAPDGGRREMLRQYVSGGGRLLAMRPDPSLAELFGLRHLRPREEMLLQYIGVEPTSEIGRGIEPSSLQYHGVADEYEVRGAAVVAWLYDDEATPSCHPAVVWSRYGEGQAVAFTYDLARSVAFMRQGNPAWACGPEACEDGDGIEGIRPIDSFLRQSGESWVNPAKIPIPQADEQQRLLANCLMELSQDVMPIPRLWYLPEGKSSVLVMTGDGDDVGFEAFDEVMRTVEEYGGHFSAYLLGLEGDPSRAQVDDWVGRGHEVACHVIPFGEEARPTKAGMEAAYESFTSRFRSLFGRDPGPSIRHHWLIWYGWAETPEIAQRHGVRVDFNYYHGRQWRLPGGRWVQGYFTGSGLPQRFVKEDGRLLDVFQVLTPWADETQLYKQQLGVDGATRVVREMLQAAEARYPTVFVANFHPGGFRRRNTEPWARNMMQEAVNRGIPIWSGEELHRFIAARDAARLSDLTWDGARLGFDLRSDRPCDSLTLMFPARFGGGRLLAVACDGATAGFMVETVAGREYAFTVALGGSHRFTAQYGTGVRNG